MIHNPILEKERGNNVSFAGTYYGGSYEERQKDMEILLKPALDFGLHIYDRQFGVTGPGSEQFRFPNVYQPAIRGRLEYSDMIKAYKEYKVFLNVNSIKTSPTMFSRRVFELLASGTPVISTYSLGIEKILGSDLVLFSESEEDTRRHLERLLEDEAYWSRLSVLGIRKVMEYHTYENRIREIFEKAGLVQGSIKQPFFTVFSVVNDSTSVKNLLKSLARQSYCNFSVVFITDKTLPQRDLKKLKGDLPGKTVEIVSGEYESAIREILDSTSASHIAVFKPEDYYGPNYLRDYALSLKYIEGRYLGKGTHFVVDSGDAVLRNPGVEFHLVSEVPTGTFAAGKNVVDPGYFPTLIRRETFESRRGDIVSLDRFNYLKRGNRENPPAGLLNSIGI